MEDYGQFQDKGVSGKKKKYNTPFTYRDKMPPSKALDKWSVRKGLAPRDKDGKFISRKSLNYLIARSIYINGINGLTQISPIPETANVFSIIKSTYEIKSLGVWRIIIDKPKLILSGIPKFKLINTLKIITNLLLKLDNEKH
jgi:hypothetical protein